MIKIQLNTENLREKVFASPKPSSEDTFIQSDLNDLNDGL